MAYMRLGDLLVANGSISAEQLQQALVLQKETGERLGTVLTTRGFLSEQQLIDALGIQLGVSFIDLSAQPPAATMAQLLSKNIAKKYNVVPVRVDGDTLYLAMDDPLDFVAIKAVRTATHKHVVPMIAMHDAVIRTIATLYGNEGAARAIEDMKLDAQDSGSATPASTVFGVEEDVSAPTVRLVNSIIERAATEHASDIHIEPRETEIQVRMRIDGVLHDILTVPKELQSAVIARLKIMGLMDVAERRVPQDGRAAIKIKGSDIDLRLSTLPTIYGEKFVIRLLDNSGDLLDKHAIGLEGQNLAQYDALMRNVSGVVLIVGPTGSGKSSSMYTMIRELNTEEKNLVTLEDPVEYNIDGVNQVQINEKVGMTFAGGLRAILRQDPDIIAVGEIRDGETAEIAMRAAMTGHLVLSTVHTNDAVSTLDRLNDIGVEPYLVASSLRGIISQRLVRRICPHCKQAYTPPNEELAALGMRPEPSLQFYRGTGCPQCFHTGYRGRTAVFEILTLNNALRRGIVQRLPRDEMLKIMRQGEYTSLLDNGKDLIRRGMTTAAEVMRTIYTGED